MFKVGKYITLKLENGKTCIYIKGELFRQCKKLIINIPTSDVDKISGFETIDEIANATKSILNDSISVKISPSLEFWGHCSNLQAWFENEYDTSLLHSNLAFPLLWELNELGDPIAKKVIKNEVSKRLEVGSDSVILFLLKNHYLDVFSQEELLSIYNNNISRFASSKLLLPFLYAFSLLKIPTISVHCKGVIKDIFFAGDFKVKKEILGMEIWSKKDLYNFFEKLRATDVNDSDQSDRFEILGLLLAELQFNYNFTLSTSEVIATMLINDEQKTLLDIFDSSPYPYIKDNFDDDRVRRRTWDKELYYDFFRGHLNSIELFCSDSNSEEFYNNLKKLRSFKDLEYLNLLFFCKVDYSRVKKILVNNIIKRFCTIKIYELSKNSQIPISKFFLKLR